MTYRKKDGVSAHAVMDAHAELMPVVDHFIGAAAKLGINLSKEDALVGRDILATLEAEGGHRFVLYITSNSLAGGPYKYIVMLSPDSAPDGYHPTFRVKRVGSSMSCADRAAADFAALWPRILEDYRGRVRAAAMLEANGFVGTGGGRYALESGYIQMRADGLLDVQFWQGMSVQRTLRALGMENVYLEDEDAA